MRLGADKSTHLKGGVELIDCVQLMHEGNLEERRPEAEEEGGRLG